MSFAELKTRRTDLSAMVQAASGGEQKTDNRNDERLWQPSRDKDGNGYAVIRFLPGSADAPTPWVRYWDHFFKGPTGQWYVEKSLTSIGMPDPLAEANSRLWNEDGSDEAKSTVRDRKRNLRYMANIQILSDPSNPENEGQVKLYRFGKKIFDKIMDTMQPQFPDEAPINPFDMWKGADFTVKIRKVEGYVNYDASSFKSPSEMAGTDDDLEAIYNKQHDMSEWTDPKNYKSYDELKSRLAIVLGESSPSTRKQAEDLANNIPWGEPTTIAAPVATSAPAPVTATAESSMEEDDTMQYFAKLAAED